MGDAEREREGKGADTMRENSRLALYVVVACSFRV